MKIIVVIFLCLSMFACSSSSQFTFEDGLKYMNEGNYEKAILVFEELLEIEPKNVEIYKYLAQCYDYSGDDEAYLSVVKNGIEKTNSAELMELLYPNITVLDNKSIFSRFENLNLAFEDSMSYTLGDKNVWCQKDESNSNIISYHAENDKGLFFAGRIKVSEDYQHDSWSVSIYENNEMIDMVVLFNPVNGTDSSTYSSISLSFTKKSLDGDNNQYNTIAYKSYNFDQNGNFVGEHYFEDLSKEIFSTIEEWNLFVDNANSLLNVIDIKLSDIINTKAIEYYNFNYADESTIFQNIN